MKILVLNGSPKGKNSITLHTSLYLQQCFDADEFEILHVGRQIRNFEKDFEPCKKALEAAELILFSYPVYTFLVPSPLHRFIELIRDSGVDLSGKFATQISTSKHFYDTTAHRFIADSCADLGLYYIKGLSADMDDLTAKKGQKEALDFWRYVRFCCERGLFEEKSAPHPSKTLPYERSFADTPKSGEGETVIVADLAENDTALAAMIEDFRAVYPYPTRLVNIRTLRIDGGCLGCFNCAADGKCIYKDGFDSFLREKIQTAAAIVLAFSVSGHSMGSRFKMYDDRQFCNGHRTVTMGMPMGYIVNGELENEENLRTVIEARADVGHNFLCGIATDGKGIADMAGRMDYALQNGYVPPQSFYGVGGMKIFRDLIYLMRGIMRADHKFYKKHGIYDFPQKKKGRLVAMLLVGSLMNNKKLRSKMGGKIDDGMVAPYKKVLEKNKPQ